MNKKIFINLKLNKDSKNTINYIYSLANLNMNFDFVVFVNYLYLINSLKYQNKHLQIGSQSGYWKDYGNYTSKVSIDLLASENVNWILLGHCEDVKFNNLNVDDIYNQLKISNDKSMNIVLCFGDEQYCDDINQRIKILINKIQSFNIFEFNLDKLIFAYEPIFAIGGYYNVNVNEIGYIISELKKYFYNSKKINLKFIYGGSVNASNFNDLYNLECLDGVLIGSFAWKIDNLKIIKENYEQ